MWRVKMCWRWRREKVAGWSIFWRSASKGGVPPPLQRAENSGGPCIDNMCFRYVKGRSRRFAADLNFIAVGLPRSDC